MSADEKWERKNQGGQSETVKCVAVSKTKTMLFQEKRTREFTEARDKLALEYPGLPPRHMGDAALRAPGHAL
jgi:hypothetical protein